MIGSVAERLESALTQHQAGALETAEQLYRDILHSEPEHADALHLLGVIAQQTGRNDEAIRLIRRALEINGPAALFLNNLGNALRAAGRWAEAVETFRAAIRVAPEYAGVRFNLGTVMEAQGDLAEAEAEYKAVIALDADFADAYNHLGRIQMTRENAREAIDYFSRAVALNRRSIDARFNLACALYANRQLTPAADAFRELLQIDPGLPEVHYQLGRICEDREDFASAISAYRESLRWNPRHEAARSRFEALSETGRLEAHITVPATAIKQSFRQQAESALLRGEFDEAVELFRSALQGDPRNVELQVNLANALLDAERLDEAIPAYQLAVEMAPHAAGTHYNLANAFRENDSLAEAADSYRSALQLDSQFADAHLNLGIALRDLGCPTEALDHFNRVLDLKPDDPQGHLQCSLTRLQLGQFEKGWDEYEWRWRSELRSAAFSAPLWDGGPLEDQVLLIHGEQGIGDEIQFASCIDEVARQTAGCLIECEPRLVPLFARSFPLADVYGRPLEQSAHQPNAVRYDVHVPMASLPRFTRRTIEAFPRHRRYLQPDPQLVQKWQRRYARIGAGVKIGISWRGGKRADHRRRRSTRLEQWSELFSIPGIDFINLQYGRCALELEQCRTAQGVTIHDWDDTDTFGDLDELAARIAACDLVISVDNSTAHFAGALGVPVWTLLCAAADFRWLLDRVDTPWYASMHLIRQPELNNWSALFANLFARLRLMTAADRAAA